MLKRAEAKSFVRADGPFLYGRVIELAMIEKGMSLGQLSMATGISPPVLSSVAGCKRWPSLRALLRIADVLEISLDHPLLRKWQTPDNRSLT